MIDSKVDVMCMKQHVSIKIWTPGALIKYLPAYLSPDKPAVISTTPTAIRDLSLLSSDRSVFGMSQCSLSTHTHTHTLTLRVMY